MKKSHREPVEEVEPAAPKIIEPVPAAEPEAPKLVEVQKSEAPAIPEGHIWDNSSGCFKKNGP